MASTVFWIAIVAIVLGSAALRTIVRVNRDKNRRLELEIKSKELDLARMKEESKLLETKGPELPSWLDKKDPEEVRKWGEANMEVTELKVGDIPKRVG